MCFLRPSQSESLVLEDLLLIYGTHYHSGLYLPIFPYLYEGPGIPKSWCLLLEWFSSLIWGGTCPVQLLWGTYTAHP